MDTESLTLFKDKLPSTIQKRLGQDVLDGIAKTLSDPEMYDSFRENLLSFSSVLKDGRYKIESYANAVKYVSYKLSGVSNREAYERTFTSKVIYWVRTGVSDKDITRYVSAYHHSKLVTTMLEQSIVPTWIVNQDLFQRALNHEAHLMVNAKSEKVQHEAAAKILDTLKRPEAAKIQLDVEIKDNSELADLRQATAALVAQQRAMISGGVLGAQEIAHSDVITIDAEVVND